MTPTTYPARIEEVEPGEFLVTFPDVPEALTSADSREAAAELARDALAVAIEGYILAGRDTPQPRPIAAGEVEIGLEPGVAARLLLVGAMKAQNINKVGLAQRMGKDEKIARRVLAGTASLDMTLQALSVMGVRPTLAA